MDTILIKTQKGVTGLLQFGVAGIVAGVLLFSAPVFTNAQVLISEIAWMGDERSSSNEWIELFNTGGEVVDLSGWSLVAGDGSPSITLSGSVESGATFLLERTSDESVPGVAASQIYTGALGNGGEVLKLLDIGGAEKDMVDASDGWEGSVGGDNSTKETAQRNDSGWITATPTLGTSLLSAQGSQNDSTQNESSGTISSGTITNTAIYSYETVVIEPPQDVFIRVPEKLTTTAGAFTKFSIESFDAKGAVVNGGNIYWAFGDGASATGRDVGHIFFYEGEYTVSVTLKQDSLSDQKNIIVTVVPLNAELKVAENGDWVSILNRSLYSLNLSNWRLVSSGQYFSIPKSTIIQSGNEVRFPTKITKLSTLKATKNVVLTYQNGKTALTSTVDILDEKVATTTEKKLETEIIADSESIPEPEEDVAKPITKKDATFSGLSIVGTKTPEGTSVKIETKKENVAIKTANKRVDGKPKQQTPQTAAVVLGTLNKNNKNGVYWYSGLVALLLFSIVGILFVRPRKLIVDGFEVVESKV